MPRSIDIILRNEMVDKAKPGDCCVFTGTLIVVPEIATLLKPGEKARLNSKGQGPRDRNQSGLEGVTGLE